MSDEKKTVKGGFRANLALILSIIALILAIVAFSRTGGQGDLSAQIKDLQARMKTIRTETTEKVNKVREETAKALEKIGEVIKKEKPSEE